MNDRVSLGLRYIAAVPPDVSCRASSALGTGQLSRAPARSDPEASRTRRAAPSRGDERKVDVRKTTS